LFGLRNAFLLGLRYEAASDLGTYNAMVREVPFYRGSDDDDKAERIMSSVFGANIVYALFTGTVCILISLYLKVIHFNALYVDMVFFFGLLIIANKIKVFYSCKFIVEKKITVLSRLDIFSGFISIVICIPLAYYFSLRGLFSGLLIVDLIYIACIFFLVRQIPSIKVSMPLIRELMKIGFPMTITLLSFTLLTSADRVIIITMLSEESLGYYGIATILFFIVYSIPEAIHSITSPRFMEKLGRHKDIHQIKHYFIEPTVLIAYFMPYLLAVFYFAIHIPIQYFLVEYIPSINVIKILIPGFFFGAVSMLPLFICYALNKQVRIIIIVLPMIMLNLILNYLFIRSGWGINGVAIGTDISFFVFSSLMIWYTLKQFEVSIEEYVRFFLLIYMPFFYAFFLILTIDNFLIFGADGFWNDTIFTSIKIGIFSLIFSFIFIFVKSQPAFIKLADNLPFTHSIRKNRNIRFSNEIYLS
jgi:O-antigen/teichoic acid export membrane protein